MNSRGGQPFSESGQIPVVDLRPATLPFLDRLGVLPGSRTLFQEAQVVQWVQDILLPTVTTPMHGQGLMAIRYLHPVDEGPQPQRCVPVVGGDRVTIRLEGDQTKAIRLYGLHSTTQIWAGGSDPSQCG
jgi:hypothetical protein